MRSNNSTGSRAASARGFVALCAMLAVGLGLMARPAAAAPFAYVGVPGGTVSVIDTATTPPAVVATVTVGPPPQRVAITPDGKHAYVTLFDSNNVSVIDTATNTVVATVTVGAFASGVAVAPDGKHAYVTNGFSDTDSVISVIETTGNTVVATVTVGAFSSDVAVTPDGKHVYATHFFDNAVSVIDTVSNTVVATIPVGTLPEGVAVNPDGKHVYVVNIGDFPSFGTVSVIDTTTNTVVATVGVGLTPVRVAVTPDGKHAYAPNTDVLSSVSVIDTATNTVAATIPARLSALDGGVAITPDGKHVYVTGFHGVLVIDTATNMGAATVMVAINPEQIGIVPPPPGIPFLAFSAKLAIQFGSIPTKDAFGFGSNFILSSTAPTINPLTDPVTLQVGTFTTTIPPGSFKKQKDGSFTFEGVIQGVGLRALIKPTGTLRYTFEAQARGANLTGTVNTVYATLAIGGGSFSNSNSGATSVTADISH